MATIPHLLGRLTASALRSAGAFEFATGFAREAASGPLRTYLADRRDDLLDALDALRDTDWSRLARALAPLGALAGSVAPPPPPEAPEAPPAPEGPPPAAPGGPPGASARPAGFGHDCASCGVPTSLAPYVPPAGEGEGIPSLCPPCLEKFLEAKVAEAERRQAAKEAETLDALYRNVEASFARSRAKMPFVAPAPRDPSAAPFGVAALFPTQRNRPAKA
jgi:hypothetical protein